MPKCPISIQFLGVNGCQVPMKSGFKLDNAIFSLRVLGIHFKACLFNLTFNKGSHSKGLKQRALLLHKRKTKHFIATLLAQPFMVLQTFLKSVVEIHSFWGESHHLFHCSYLQKQLTKDHCSSSC